MNQSLSSLNSIDNWQINMNLKNPKTLRLKNVLQYFWVDERLLSGGSPTCKRKCSSYTNSGFDGGDGCMGSVRNCEQKVSFFRKEEQQLVGSKVSKNHITLISFTSKRVQMVIEFMKVIR